jgi:hypothetical protein
MEHEAQTAPDTLWLKKMDGRWRIVGVESQLEPHLSPGVALRRYARDAADSARISEWLRGDR